MGEEIKMSLKGIKVFLQTKRINYLVLTKWKWTSRLETRTKEAVVHCECLGFLTQLLLRREAKAKDTHTQVLFFFSFSSFFFFSLSLAREGGRGKERGGLWGEIKDGKLPCRPIMRLVQYWCAVKQVRRDPKDGELRPGRIKSEETLMEVRSDTDVQIVRQT